MTHSNAVRRSAAVKLGATLLLVAGGLGLLTSGAGQAGAKAKPNRYIGAEKCKNCHGAENTGDQFGAWTRMKHSEAFALLASDEAKTLGAPLDVAEPQKSPKCLKCHVTAYEKPKEEIKKGFKPELGVQCETCHGPGEAHMKARFAAALAAGSGERTWVAVPEDEIIRKPTVETCLGCHNEESPGFKAFCFNERMSKIRHINPTKPRTAEEKAALLVCGCGEACTCKHGSIEGCGVPPREE